jgi:hypothetical protein
LVRPEQLVRLVRQAFQAPAVPQKLLVRQGFQAAVSRKLLAQQEFQSTAVSQKLRARQGFQSQAVSQKLRAQDWVVRQPSYKCYLNFTGLSVFIPLNTDSFARAFSSTRVGWGSLAANRKSTNMPDTAITADGLQAFEIRLNIAAKVAFDQQPARIDHVHDLAKLLGREVLCASVWIDIGLFKNPSGGLRT